jgi:hypothetical protein
VNSLFNIEQVLKGEGKPPTDYFWTQSQLDEVWRSVAPPVLKLAAHLANLSDSPEAVATNQKALPREYSDLATMSHEDLLEFCGQVRTLWRAFDLAAIRPAPRPERAQKEAYSILDKWWKRHPLVQGPHWNIFWHAGTFFPNPMNWRALIGRVCFDNREYLGMCKGCKKCFVKPRINSSYCMDEGCRRYDNLQRQKKYLLKHGGQKGRPSSANKKTRRGL